MFCNNCKKEIEPNSAFCSHCGARLTVSEAPVAPIQETPSQEPFTAPVQPVNIAPPPPPVPYMEVRAEKPKKEATFFGKGALIACLVVIGILSCSTTVFATLFFTILGRI